MPQTITAPPSASTEEARAEAHAHGINTGWRDANMSAAEGSNYGAETFVRSAARQAAERYSEGSPSCRYGTGSVEFWGFVHGYAEGVERHQADQWQDGTPRHTEPEEAGA